MARTTAVTLDQAVKQSPRKWVYLFSEGNASMRALLGGKGAGVAEMTNAGLPVPPGFTITTEACNEYYTNNEQFPDGMWEQAQAALRVVEEQTGKTFGDAENPLLVSVRSGAKFSMPGMMDTVLNLGLNDETVKGLIARSGDERFCYDAYRRFVQMFSKIVLDAKPDAFEHKINEYRRRRRGQPTPRFPPTRSSRWSRTSNRSRATSGQPSPKTPSSSSGWPSRRSSLPGTTSAPSTTATSTRSPRPWHRRQRPDHGLRQHGRHQRDRRRLHAQSLHRREAALRRLSDQRPGRRCRRGHPQHLAHRRAGRGDARGLPAVRADRRARWRSTTATCRIWSSPSSRGSSTCSRRARPSAPPPPPSRPPSIW